MSVLYYRLYTHVAHGLLKPDFKRLRFWIWKYPNKRLAALLCNLDLGNFKSITALYL